MCETTGQRRLVAARRGSENGVGAASRRRKARPRRSAARRLDPPIPHRRRGRAAPRRRPTLELDPLAHPVSLLHPSPASAPLLSQAGTATRTPCGRSCAVPSGRGLLPRSPRASRAPRQRRACRRAETGGAAGGGQMASATSSSTGTPARGAAPGSCRRGILRREEEQLRLGTAPERTSSSSHGPSGG